MRRVCAGVCRQRRLDAGRPRARRLAQQQPLVVARAVAVVADGGAVPRRGARHRARGRRPCCWRLRAGTPRRLPSTCPTSRSTAAPWPTARGVAVVADGGAVPRRGARHRGKVDVRVVPASAGSDASTPAAHVPDVSVNSSPLRWPSCRCSGRRRCSSPPRRTTPIQGTTSGGRAGVCGQRRLDAGRPSARGLGQQQPLFDVASCRCSRRRRCSSPPRRTTPRRGRRSMFVSTFAGSDASTPVAHLPEVSVNSSPCPRPELSS